MKVTIIKDNKINIFKNGFQILIILQYAHQFINIYEKLFNLIFERGIIPESWVIGKIKSIYKNKGDSSEHKNYRPITILSCLVKLLHLFCVTDFVPIRNTLLYSLNIKLYDHIKPFFCWLCTFVFHNTLACVFFIKDRRHG